MTDLKSIDQAVEECLVLVAERQREEEFRRQQAEEAEAKARYSHAVMLCDEVARDYGLALDLDEIAEHVQYGSFNKYRLYWRPQPRPMPDAKVEALVAEQEPKGYYPSIPEDRKRWYAARWIYDADADLGDEDTKVRFHDSFKTNNFVAALTFALTGQKLTDER